MNSQQIKCFLAVASFKSFSSAAEHLFLSQSVVSYHIRALEKELEFLLFQRDTHGVRLTAAGEVFERSMRTLSEEYAEAIELARQIGQRNEQHIRICFGSPTSSAMMGRIIQEIYGHAENSSIMLSNRNQYDILQPLLSGSADILLTYPGFFQEGIGLSKKKIATVWTVCLASPQHPLSARTSLKLRDLLGQTLILPDIHSVNGDNPRIEFETLYRWVQRNQSAVQIDFSARTLDQAQGIAASGRGVMFTHSLESGYQRNDAGLVSIPLVDIDPIPLLALWRDGTLGKAAKELIQKLELT